MKSVATSGVGSFANAVPVSGGFIVHHGKQLTVPKEPSLMFVQSPPVSHNVCLHNGQPIDGTKTAFHVGYLKPEQDLICSDLCMRVCNNNHKA
jgi:hypothetical protein